MKARHDRVSRDPLSLGKSKQEPFSVVLLERESEALDLIKCLEGQFSSLT